MKNKILKSMGVLFSVALLFVSCKKEDNKNSDPDTRKVKYELEGNFTGRLLVITSTNSGVLQQFSGVAIPWSKEITYDKSVMGAGASLQTENENKGVPGQMLMLKVYLNDKLKDTKTATADANGVVNITMSFYTF